jgi:uncharacterized delta-60 repeat protein
MNSLTSRVLVAAAGLLLTSCEPILLKVATSEQVTNYIETGKGTVSAPVFSLPAGAYANDKLLSFSATPAGASFRYTTDGSDPTATSGNVYLSPIPVPTGTVKVVASLSGYASSPVVSRAYQSFQAGNQDATFGHGGVMESWDYDHSGAYPEIANAEFHAVGVQSNGKILVSGYYNYTHQSEAVTRVLADGSYIDGRHSVATGAFGIILNPSDPTQQPAGTYYHYLGTDTANLVAQAIQPDDQIVVAGTRDGAWLVERVLADGSGLDPNFGTAGVASDPFGGAPITMVGIALQSDGKVLVAANTASAAVVVRYTTAGQLDSSYGSGGVASITFGGAGPPLVSLMVNRDNQAIVVGRGALSAGQSIFSARFTDTGASDSSWGGDSSKVTYGTGSVQSFRWHSIAGTGDLDSYLGSKVSVLNPTAAAVQSDGKVVFVAQLGQSPSGVKVAYGRLGTDGLPDASYNPQTGGVLSIVGSLAPAVAIAINAADKAVILEQDAKIFRMTIDGGFDPSFNGSGKNSDLVGLGYTPLALGFALNGSLLVCGYDMSALAIGEKQGIIFRFW